MFRKVVNTKLWGTNLACLLVGVVVTVLDILASLLCLSLIIENVSKHSQMIIILLQCTHITGIKVSDM